MSPCSHTVTAEAAVSSSLQGMLTCASMSNTLSALAIALVTVHLDVNVLPGKGDFQVSGTHW